MSTGLLPTFWHTTSAGIWQYAAEAGPTKQESLADGKVSARQQCVYED